MITHTLNIAYQTPNGNLSTSQSVSGDLGIDLDVALLSNDTAKEIDLAITNSQLKSLVLVSTQDMTVKTNHSDGTADDTVALLANVPQVFVASVVGTNPFAAANVTKLYVNNTSGVAASLKIKGLLDITP